MRSLLIAVIAVGFSIAAGWAAGLSEIALYSAASCVPVVWLVGLGLGRHSVSIARETAARSTDAALEGTYGSLLAAARHARIKGLFSLEDKVNEFSDPVARSGLLLLSAGSSGDEIQLALDSKMHEALARLDSGILASLTAARMALMAELLRCGVLLMWPEIAPREALPLGLVALVFLVLIDTLPHINSFRAAGYRLMAAVPRYGALLCMIACGRGRAACHNWLEAARAESE